MVYMLRASRFSLISSVVSRRSRLALLSAQSELKQTLRCGGREKRVCASLFSPRSPPPPRTDENDALLLL